MNMKKIVLGTLVLGVAAFAAVNLGACKGCHGQNFEKKALGKSKIVKDMTKADVNAAMVGYKNGTYGGAMKGVMKGQVARYSEADLRATGLGK
jgi:cytochrome c-type protein NapB